MFMAWFNKIEYIKNRVDNCLSFLAPHFIFPYKLVLKPLISWAAGTKSWQPVRKVGSHLLLGVFKQAYRNFNWNSTQLPWLVRQ